jgi:hypothetical protein
MAGLVPAIHVLLATKAKTWMPGTRPGMTTSPQKSCYGRVFFDNQCDAFWPLRQRPHSEPDPPATIFSFSF